MSMVPHTPQCVDERRAICVLTYRFAYAESPRRFRWSTAERRIYDGEVQMAATSTPSKTKSNATNKARPSRTKDDRPSLMPVSYTHLGVATPSPRMLG